jgi:nucleoid-associated protein YgaU
VRLSVLIGSGVALLLLLATTALVWHRGGSPTGDAKPDLAALSRQAPASDAGGTAAPNPAPQPSVPVPPSFDIVKVGPTGTAVIAGRAEPGSKVIVRDGDKIIGEVAADRRGEWVLVPDQPIGPGDRLLSVEASTGEGSTTIKSEETVALSVSRSSPGSKDETALAVVLPRDGTGSARVLQRPDGSSPTSTQNSLALDSLDYDAQGRAVLSGRAAPGATIRIYLGNAPLATVTADAAGQWSATAARAIGSGHIELRLDQLGPDGRVAQRVALPLERPATTQLAAGQSYTVQPGNNLWQMARRAYGAGTRYLIIYSANLGQIRDPERIYPGQVFKLPKS